MSSFSISDSMKLSKGSDANLSKSFAASKNSLRDAMNIGKTVKEPEPIEDDEVEFTPYEVSEDERITLDEFANNDSLIQDIRDYSIDRYGIEDGGQRKGESNRQYLNRFLREVHRFENNSVYLSSMIDYLRNADDDQRRTFGRAYEAYLQTPMFYEEGGAGMRAVGEVVAAGISDPINLFTAGFGRLFASTAGKQAAQKGITKFLTSPTTKAVAAGAVTEGTLGVAEDIGLQDIERKGKVFGKEDISLTQAAIVGGASSVLGGALAGVAQKGVPNPLRLLKRKKKASPDELIQAKETAKANEIETFDPVNGPVKSKTEIELEGRRALDKQGKPTPISEMQVRKELSRQMTRVVTNLVKEQKELIDSGQLDLSNNLDFADKKYLVKVGDKVLEKKDKVGDFVQRILDDPDKIDSDALSRALKKENISAETFTEFLQSTENYASMQKLTLSDAAKTMNAYSQLGKLKKKIVEVSPEFKKRADELFGADEEMMDGLGRFNKFFRNLDRNRRALMVSQIATTVRNAATGLSVVTFQTGADMMEAALYYGGKSVKATLTGNASLSGFKRGLVDASRDAFGTLAYLSEQGLSKELADITLHNNPRLNNTLFRTLQEVGDDSDGLWWVSKKLNYLNLQQDSFFRRAFYTASIDKSLRRTGTSLADVVREGKDVPLSILKKGVDDALKGTFAHMPKKGAAHHFIKFVETIPATNPITAIPSAFIGTGAFPFARFMANAMAFQLKYSPLNGAYAVLKTATNGKKLLTGTLDQREAMDITERMSQGLVGSAALYAAYQYRANNQDTEWFNVKDAEGRTFDLRPFFPAAPYLVVADIIYKSAILDEDRESTLSNTDARTLIQGFTGAQFRAGAASTTIDRFFEIMGQEPDISTVQSERLAEMVGEYLGEITGGFVTTARMFKDVMAQFNEESSIVRDSRQVTGEGAVERGLSAFNNAVTKNIPFFEEQLPEFQDPTKPETLRKQSPLLGLFGMRFRERPTEVESELTSLGLLDYKIVPSTGDKTADSYIKKHLGQLTDTFLPNLINSDRYANYGNSKKKIAVNDLLKTLRATAKTLAKVDAEKDNGDKTYTPFDRAQWLKVPKLQRDVANEYYKANNGGTSIEEAGEYRLGSALARTLAKGVK